MEAPSFGSSLRTVTASLPTQNSARTPSVNWACLFVLQPIYVPLCRLHKYVEVSELPEEMGGTWSYCHNQWIQNRIVRGLLVSVLQHTVTGRRKEFSFIIRWRKRDKRDFGLLCSGRGRCVAEFVGLGVSYDPSAYILLSRDLGHKLLFFHFSTFVCLDISITEDEGNTPGRNVGKHKPCNTGGFPPHCLT